MMPHGGGSREMYPAARDSPQFSRTMSQRRRASTMMTTEVPIGSATSPKTEMLQRQSSLGNSRKSVCKAAFCTCVGVGVGVAVVVGGCVYWRMY